MVYRCARHEAPMSEILKSYELLGLQPGASSKAIKKAYRDSVKKWHPDQFASQPQQRQQAEEKLKDINLAFERIQEDRAANPRRNRGAQRPARSKSNSPRRQAPRPHEPEPGYAPRTDADPDAKEPPVDTSHAASDARRHESRFVFWNQLFAKPAATIFALLGIVLAGLAAMHLFVANAPEASTTDIDQSRQEQNPQAFVSQNALLPSGPETRLAQDQGATALGLNLGRPDDVRMLPSEFTEEVGSTRAFSNAAEPASELAAVRDGSHSGQSELSTKLGNGKPPWLPQNPSPVPADTTTLPDSKAPSEAARLSQVIASLKEKLPPERQIQEPAVPVEGPDAHFERGLRYATGGGVVQSYGEAVRWCRLAADAGHAEAQKNLGFLYATGKGVPQDNGEAEKWFRKAAALGSIGADFGSAIVALAKANEKRLTVVRDQGANNSARAKESPEALFQRGLRSANGDGVPQNYTEAANWYRLAAEAGHAAAQKNLGFLYATGKGVPKNDEEAEKWFRKAAEQGNVGAEFANALVGLTKADRKNEPDKKNRIPASTNEVRP